MVDFTLTVMVQNDFGHIFPVKLPEDPYVLDDILADNHVFTGRDCRIDDVRWVDFPDIVIDSTDDVTELNYIATQFVRHGYDADRYTSILKAIGGGSHRAVDLATHFDSVAFYSDIYSFRDLGIAFLRGRVDKDPSLSYSDHYLIECGKYAMRQMDGIFQEDGAFVGFPREFLHKKYDGHCLPDHDDMKHPFITLKKTSGHWSIPPTKIPGLEHRQGPTLVSDPFEIKLPLSSSAATIYRKLMRVNLDPHSFRNQLALHFSFKPVEEEPLTIRGSIGQVAEAALCYEQMNFAQRKVFRDMLRTSQQHHDVMYLAGQGKKPPQTGTLMWNEKMLERMECEHGFEHPVSKEPVSCIVRNKRLAEMPQKVVFPLSNGGMQELVDNLALEGPKDPDFQVVTFSLDNNCGHIQRLAEQGVTMEDFNQSIAALIDEPEPDLLSNLGMESQQL